MNRVAKDEDSPFIGLVRELASACSNALEKGKRAEVRRILEHMAALVEKTEGNLSESERATLKGTLGNLRLRYVALPEVDAPPANTETD